MKNPQKPIDQNSFIRFFHIHCFINLIKIYSSQDASQHFSAPRFELFKPIKKLYEKKKVPDALFYNILFSYQNQIILGSIVTLIFASCNLLVPQLIKSFLQFMQLHHVNKSQAASGQKFILNFFFIQFVRIIFGQHAKRLFYELAIQIQSSLCKKMIRKSISFDRQFRDRIPKSEIMQLENVDLKLAFLMFKNMYLVIQAPFTVFVAIIMLFRQNPTYGLIGIYWFVIAFLLQRQLDGRMRKCNQTKLKLIDERSKVNYQLFGKIKEAKLIHFQNILVQKNNDLFIQENHDHQLYYFYSTLYDITLLILPIIVVVTISVFDMNNDDHITVEQVYVMLGLLGICYNPMKSFRTIMITFHDGFHSLKRIDNFFNFPDENQSSFISEDISIGQIMVKQGTICSHPNISCDFVLHVTKHIEVQRGKRLIIIGKKGQGKTSFIRMILGQMKTLQGMIFINGKRASSFQDPFFRKASILDNIVFCQQRQDNETEYKQKVRKAEILYKELGLQTEFIKKNGIRTIIDAKSLTERQSKKLCLARAFISDPDIYFLQDPFRNLDKACALVVQKKLRQKQEQNKTVLMTLTSLEYVQQQDSVLIFQNGISIEYGFFDNLVRNPQSKISNFFKDKGDKDTFKEPDSARKIIGKFKSRVSTALSFVQFSDDSNDSQPGSATIVGGKFKSKLKYRSSSLMQNLKKKQKKLKTKQTQDSMFLRYFPLYWKSISFKELSFALVIIAVAQFLHIFIHFYIGHLDKDQQDNPYLQFQNILFLQFILTMALAGIVFLEGEVSSLISIIQGNTLYELSLKSIVKKPIDWFKHQFLVKLADKFNHDYEEIFIACHNLLGIYKNVIILIITIYFVSSDASNVFVIFFMICLIYLTIGYILRKVEHKVVKHFYDYKYEFVKLFQQSLQGGVTIQVFQAQEDYFIRTQKIYKQVAAYKLAQSYTSYGEEMLCDITSLILLVFAFYYALHIKNQGINYNIAVMGTTIHLLLNVSEVLKTIVKFTINFQSFFNINIAPFMQTLAEKEQTQDNQQEDEDSEDQFIGKPIQKRKNTQLPYDIKFDYVYIPDQGENLDAIKSNKLNLSIKEESTVTIYQPHESGRNKLIQAFTKNNEYLIKNNHKKCGKLLLGGLNIKEIPDQCIADYVGIITSNNFFFTGTLAENITWKRGKLTPYENFQTIQTARCLSLDVDLQNFDQLLLNCPITFVQGQINSQLGKKIALLRILLKKPKIVIVKNTSEFIGDVSLFSLIKNSYFCTIIKIVGNAQQIPEDLARVIYMQNLKVIEDGKIQRLLNDDQSKLGKLLKQFNRQGYVYQNQVLFSPRKFKKRPNQSDISSGFHSQRSSFTQYSDK